MMRRFHSFAIICLVLLLFSLFFRYSIRYIRFSTWILEIRRYTFNIIQSTLYIYSVVIHYVALFVQ